MAKRSKAPARPNSVQDRDALINAIARKGELDRQRADLCAVAEAQVTDIMQHLKLALVKIDAEINQLETDVHGFAETNRSTLLPPNRKSINLGVGEIGWRSDPTSVVVIGTIADAVAKIEAAALSQFLRIEKNLNKDALLAFRREYLKADDSEIGQMTRRTWADLMVLKAVKFVDGEKFWMTPATVVMPEHAGAPAVAATEGVAA